MGMMRSRSAGWFPLLSIVTVGALLGALEGCASTTVINSQPPGARLSVNGAVVGNTPYTLSDTKIVGSTTQLKLEYPGYQPLDTTIQRNEELDVLALVGGIFLLVPFFWIMKYQPAHNYALQAGGAPAWGQPPAAYGQPPAPPSTAPAYPPPATAPPGPAGYPPPPPGYPPPAAPH